MHSLERFALSTGVKIKTPKIYEDYYPLKDEKFITFSPIGIETNNYSYWDEVMELVLPKLESLNIKVYQFGTEEKVIKGCKLIQGPSYNQASYIISKSILHVGVDGCFIHFANNNQKKIVALYSHVLASHKGPYWKDNANHVILEPERTDTKPPYAAQEMPRSIDTIEPEKIAKAIFKLLEVDFDYDYKTVACGRDYNLNFVDLVPNKPMEAYGVDIGNFRVRMDLFFNEQILNHSLNNARGAVEIITNKPINFDLLAAHKDKIKSIIFKYDNETPELNGWIERLSSLKINFAFVSHLPEEQQNQFKLKYMDFVLLQKLEHNTKENFNIESTKDLYYKSNKIILSDGKYYPSIYCMKHNLPVDGPVKEIRPVVDDPEFWKDSDDFIILKKEVD